MKKYSIEFTEDEIDDLSGLIDGCLGTSESNDFNRVFKRILKRLDKCKSGRKVNPDTKAIKIQDQ